MIYGHKESAWIVDNLDLTKCSPKGFSVYTHCLHLLAEGKPLGEQERKKLGALWEKQSKTPPGPMNSNIR